MIHIITLHEKNSTDFLTNNGLGILSKCTEAIVEEELNGKFCLTIKYPIDAYLSSEIIEGRIIVCEVGYGSRQAFRIYKTSKSLDEKVVYANHIFYDLMDNFLEDVYPKNQDGSGYIDWILSHTQYTHKFSGYSDISKVSTARYVRKNPVNAIMSDEENSAINLYSAELNRDNYNIGLLTRRGEDRGVYIRYKKNINGITFNTDNSTIGTRIMPKGYDELLLPEKYIDSEIINNYAHPIIKVIEYEDVKIKSNEDEDGFTTLDECYTEMRNRVAKEFENGLDKPSISAEIDFIELSKTLEYKNYSNLEKVYLGDTVTIYVSKLDINVKERVISTTYNVLSKKFTKMNLGNLENNIVSENSKFQSSIKNEILPNLSQNILSEAKENATNQIKTALGGYIYKTQSELFIMDTSDINTATKVWRWNLSGLGYSSTGINGDYGIAITQDGAIVADYITSGILNANLIKAGNIRSVNYKENKTGLSINMLTGEIDSRYFKVSSNGKITSTSGAIGGWNIDAESLYKNFGGNNGIGILSTNANANIAIYAGAPSSNIAVAPMRIYYDGTVNFTKGNIGGINLGDTGIFYSGTSKNDGFGLWKNGIHKIGNSYIIFHAGANGSNIGGANFKVMQNGKVYCNDIEITGGSLNVQNAGTNHIINIQDTNSNDDCTYMSARYIGVNSAGKQMISFGISYDNGTYLGRQGSITVECPTSASTGVATYVKGTGITTPSITQTSDERVKENISLFDKKAIDLIKFGKIYNFNFKNSKDRKIGFVIGKNYNTPEEIIKGNDSLKGVDIYSMSAIMWKGLQELVERIETIEERIL